MGPIGGLCGRLRWFQRWMCVVGGIKRLWVRVGFGLLALSVGFGVPGSREGTQHLRRFAAMV